jgi:hypothetical protein
LPNNDRRDTYTDTQTDGEIFMNYSVEVGSGAMIYIPSFINIGSDIQKLMGGGIHRHRQHGDRINLLSFFQNKESRLKIRLSIKNPRKINKLPPKSQRIPQQTTNP